MKILVYVFSCFVIWFSPAGAFYAADLEKKEALVFNRFTEMPVKIPRKVSKDTECGAWAVACPAGTAGEEEFVKRYSYTENALFVQQVHTKDAVKAIEVKKEMCKEPPKISLLYNLKSYTFQFGYEIYYKLGDYQFFHLGTYKDYKTPKKVTESLKSFLKRGIFEAKEYYRIIKNGFGLDVTELWLEEDRRMEFLWIYLFKLTFNFPKKILKMAWYQIEDNSRWATGVRCDDYTLGIETYEGNEVDDLYKNEERIFQNIKLPDDICLPDTTCLVKWSLIPIDQFRFGSSAPPVCSNMATIPIWRKKVERVLIKLDAYLYALFRTIEEPLIIITGISGELELAKKKGWGKSTLYLDSQNKKIPVPKIIYKIVEYRQKDCLMKDDQCTYSVIIIIHNYPFFKPSDKLCSETDLTSRWGWQSVKEDIDGNDSEIIYVCLNEKSLQKKLWIGSKENVAGGISLYNFPFRENYHAKFDGNDIKYFVDEKFKELSDNGDDPELLDGDIKERVQALSNTEDPEVREQMEKEMNTS